MFDAVTDIHFRAGEGVGIEFPLAVVGDGCCRGGHELHQADGPGWGEGGGGKAAFGADDRIDKALRDTELGGHPGDIFMEGQRKAEAPLITLVLLEFLRAFVPEQVVCPVVVLHFEVEPGKPGERAVFC